LIRPLVILGMDRSVDVVVPGSNHENAITIWLTTHENWNCWSSSMVDGLNEITLSCFPLLTKCYQTTWNRWLQNAISGTFVIFTLLALSQAFFYYILLFLHFQLADLIALFSIYLANLVLPIRNNATCSPSPWRRCTSCAISPAAKGFIRRWRRAFKRYAKLATTVMLCDISLPAVQRHMGLKGLKYHKP
jgi:hypothetical protein